MKRLKANVGRRPHRHCYNLTTDQTTVMTLLSRIPETFGGAPGKLNFIVRPGYCADDLYQAILRFQQMVVQTLSRPDGIVEPGGATLVYLNRIADLNLPTKTINDPKMYDKMIDMYYDESKKIYFERSGSNAPEYQRKLEREHTAAVNKWHAWKERIRKDGHGGLSAKLAIQFLDDQEKKSKDDPDLPFFHWAYGFGDAFIDYDDHGDWTRQIMLETTLLDAYDKRKLIVNTHGIKKDPAVIVFGNFTHYVMKKEEMIEFKVPV